MAVESMKRGACDYLPKPFSPAQVELVTRKVAEQRALEQRVESLRSIGAGDPDIEFPVASTAMRRPLELARRVAPSNATLLIRGEVGTGKGRLARAIHTWSGRPASAFASASCQNTSADVLE